MGVRRHPLVTSLEYGGLEKLVVSFAEHGDRGRFDMRVVTLAEGGVLRSRLQALGVEVHGLGRGGLLRRASASADFFGRAQPGILHTHNPSPHLLGVLARSGGRVAALVHTKHGTNLNVGSRGRVLNHWAARFTDALVAVSRNAAEVAIEAGARAGRQGLRDLERRGPGARAGEADSLLACDLRGAAQPGQGSRDTAARVSTDRRSAP